MWRKRLNVSVFLCLSLGLSGLQAQRIYLEGQEGTQQAYFLSDIKKMSFSSGAIKVFRLDGGLDDFAIMDVRNLHFNMITSAEEVAIPEPFNGTFQAFPNPVMDLLNIQLSSPPGSTGRIEIISLEGKVVQTRDLEGNTTYYRINLSKLASGLYICRINSGSVVQTRKIIKR